MNRRLIPTRAYDATEIYTWFERDREHVKLRDVKTEETILEFWDEDVEQEIDMGFLDPRDWHGSMLEMAIERGFYVVPDEIDEYADDEEDYEETLVAGAI